MATATQAQRCRPERSNVLVGTFLADRKGKRMFEVTEALPPVNLNDKDIDTTRRYELTDVCSEHRTMWSLRQMRGTRLEVIQR